MAESRARAEPSTPPRSNDTDIQDDNGTSSELSRGLGSESQDDTSTSPAVSWMLRVRSRNDELKKYFGLPSSENLLDEFHCALRWRILLQGRMYVFDSFVCFYSNVFGYLKNKAIPLKDVIAVKKKTHFRFPNSVELECRDGGRYFFTSFLSRDEAYRLISNAWHQCSDNAPDSSDDGGSSHAASSLPSLSAPASRRALTLDISNLDSGSDLPPPPSTRTERRVFFGMNSCRTPATARGSRALPHALSEGAEALKQSNDFLADARSPLLQGADRSMDEEEEDALSERDSASHEDDDLWTEAADGPPPPKHKEYKVLFSQEVPCSPKEFYTRFLSNESRFYEECQEAAGDRRVIVTNWRRDQQLGLLRDLSFVTPIKSAFANWGTSTTQCYQTQRLSAYANNTLLLETSQNMSDIPYGDCFSVDMHILITPAGTPPTPPPATASTPAAALSPRAPAAAPTACTVTASLRVNFTRKCLFRRIIESGTNKECLDFYTDFITHARTALQSPPAGTLPPPAQSSSPHPLPSPANAGAAPQGALLADPQQPGHHRMPSLTSLDASLTFKTPPALDLSSGTARPAPPGLFGLHPAALLLLLTTLLLQVVLLVAWLRQPGAAAPAAIYSTPQHWLLQLSALQEESRVLQARMELVAREAALVMQQLQQQFQAPAPPT